MAADLGHWVQSLATERWRFELSEKGRAVAGQITELSDAAEAALVEYLDSGCETASCLRGAFRDGFSNGVEWARQRYRD